MPRPHIPNTLKQKLLYESRYCCSICQKTGCQIHHIDQNHSNNNENNLIVLCPAHHDEAHTIRTMSNNLSASNLRHAKQEWTKQVKDSRRVAATLAGQTSINSDEWLSSGIAWGYINHKRVAQMSCPAELSSVGAELLIACRQYGIVDEHAIIIKPSNLATSDTYIRNSVYDWFEYGNDQRLHKLYSEMVDQIGRSNSILHLESNGWTKARLRSLIKSGTIIFLNKGIYFKSVNETQTNDHRRCITFKNKVQIEFFVDTIDMFGTTSMTVSYQGHQTCAAMLIVKSASENEEGKLILSCTPIALGTGFKDVNEITTSLRGNQS